jgi:CRISPR-associated endonuclease/helicase Cas3
MEDVLGKSDGTSLLAHIEDCLGVFAELRETLPTLHSVARLENFWELLFFTIYLHDWGKSHVEFQKALYEKENVWNYQRHEIFSVPFVDKLNLPETDRLLIKRAILGHHKSFDQLIQKHRTPEELEIELDCIYAGKNHKFHPEDFVKNLRCSLNYTYLKMMVEKATAYQQRFISVEKEMLTETVTFEEMPHPVPTIARPTRASQWTTQDAAYWQNLLLIGATKICDHYGSAQIKKIYQFAVLDFDFLETLRQKLIKKGNDFYAHQKAASVVNGNAILIAPTGSGKTESAIGWLRAQISIFQGRAFYILPYTASINAMHRRLINDFSGNETPATDLIGIQHGKLTHYLSDFYNNITDAELEGRISHERLKNMRDIYKKIVQPLKITTPFQILKFCYGVKGFEMGFASLAGAKLIFDEIHAYDVTTFAQILVSLKYFVEHFQCSVFIMTATLPSFMLKALQEALNVSEPIWAEKQLLHDFTRHTVKVLEGQIFDYVESICENFRQGKRIIVVCNTVRHAQKIYDDLQERLNLDSQSITLLHSRFTATDRSAKEAGAFRAQNRILIGTQAIEVSLDIDYDVMFTEPAPLDALLQRFGRVNRRREKGICPVYVCTVGGEFDHLIYPKDVVKRTLEILSQVQTIHEEKLQEMLDYVYPDWETDQKTEFENTKTNFLAALENLQPYADHKENEEEFYDKFDGIQVLPAPLFQQYQSAILNFDFLEADKMLVTIHRGMYFKLKKTEQIENRVLLTETPSGKIIKKYVMLAKCQYNSEVGMTDEVFKLDDFVEQCL